MSNDSTRGTTCTAAGMSFGLSNTAAAPVSRVASPSISHPPLMPRSMRYRTAKRTSASNVSMPPLCSTSRIRGTSPRRAERRRALGVGGADVEVRPLPVVAHEERAAVLEAAVEMNHGDARALRARDHAVARLENEAAGDHAPLP